MQNVDAARCGPGEVLGGPWLQPRQRLFYQDTSGLDEYTGGTPHSIPHNLATLGIRSVLADPCQLQAP
ncbi:hypothetical protein D9M72_553960 [compost metagenome]